jgi:hypothetical protein
MEKLLADWLQQQPAGLITVSTSFPISPMTANKTGLFSPACHLIKTAKERIIPSAHQHVLNCTLWNPLLLKAARPLRMIYLDIEACQMKMVAAPESKLTQMQILSV